MGTTLQNGVYLPNEGERNCYAGLKTNWEILDQKVADVTALQQAVAGALHRQIVTQLPTEDIDPNTIYMILSGTSATENVYNEYMYVNNAWELIGTSATDLTNYYTKSEVDGKLLLKANASDLTSHTGDTTIHVTTADKNKWNNQTYVFRYSSTVLVASSTNSNALLDNTDNLKVGDKVIDSSGVLFSITAIDTQNSTFTIGTALIDLAQDNDVVHKSGNETISGTKTFGNGTLIVDNGIGNNVHGEIKLNGSRSGYIVADNASDGIFENAGCGISILLQDAGKPLHIGGYKVDSNGRIFVDNTNKNPVLSITSGLIRTSTLVPENDTGNSSFRILSQIDYANGDTSKVLDVRFTQFDNGASSVYPVANNKTDLGLSGSRWKSVYATNYYYGSNNVEFSTKFVTTDTAQTISGVKTFSDNISTKKIISNVAQLQINARSNADSVAIIAGADASDGGGLWLYGKNSGVGSDCRLQIYNTTKSRYERVDLVGSQFLPTPSGELDCGGTLNKWKSFNGLNPGCLSLPDFSNAIDISSYITVTGGSTTNSTYTPLADGYISVNLGRSSGAIGLVISNGKIEACVRENTFPDNHRECGGFIPVQKNDTVVITSCLADSIIWAYFIPCLGNV